MKTLYEHLNESLETVYSEDLMEGLKTEIKNGFKWNKNANYRLRYNKYIRGFEVFDPESKYGKPQTFNIYTDNENEGEEIIKQLQQKYGKGSGSISYGNTTYGF